MNVTRTKQPSELPFHVSDVTGTYELRVADLEPGLAAGAVARTVAERMLGRELNRDEHVEWVPALTEAFAASGYDYTALVRDLAQSEIYQTIR